MTIRDTFGVFLGRILALEEVREERHFSVRSGRTSAVMYVSAYGRRRAAV